MPGVTLFLFGSPRLTGDPDGPAGAATFRHRLALLALLARAPGQTLTRDRLAGFLWPDVEDAKARHRLNVAVHELRKLLGEAALRSEADRLSLDTTVIRVDVLEFEDALKVGDLPRAVAAYTAPFLDGFFLRDAVEFGLWVDRERSEFGAAYCQALEELASRTDRDGDPIVALQWHRRLVELDPYNSRYVLRFMLALERAGDAANALLVAQRHEELLSRELGTTPDQEFRRTVERLRNRPAGLLKSSGRDPASQLRSNPVPSAPPAGAPIPVRKARWPLLLTTGFLVLFGLAGLLLAKRWETNPRRVLVVPLENRTGDPRFDGLGWVVADWISQGAVGSGLPEIIDPFLAFGRFRDSAPDLTPSRVMEMARVTRAGAVVIGTLYRVADSLRFQLRISTPGEGKVLTTLERAMPLSASVTEALGPLRSSVLGALAAWSDRRLDALGPAHTSPPTYEAYLAFVVGTEAFLTSNLDAAADRFLEAVAIDSTFLSAKVMAATSMLGAARFREADSLARQLDRQRVRLTGLDQLGLDWILASLDGDRVGTYRSSREASHLAPNSRWTVTFAEEAMRMNRPREAVQALRAVDAGDAWLGDWPEYHRVLGRALHLLGRYREELTVVRRARAQPADFNRQAIAESRALAGLGRVDEILHLVDETLALGDRPYLNPGSVMQRSAEELRVHGHPGAAKAILERAISYYQKDANDSTKPVVSLWALGSVLYRAGYVDSAELAFELMRKRGSCCGGYRVHGFFGALAATRGDRALALAYDDSLATPAPRLTVWDRATMIYYRARIAAQLGERERAVALLQEAMALGWPPGLDSIHIEPELEPLRGLPAFDQLVRLDDGRQLIASPAERPRGRTGPSTRPIS